MYVVTGGSGFFGQHLVRFLVEKGCEVVSLDVIAPAGYLPSVRYATADVRSEEALRAHIQPGDVVIHNAALVPLARDERGFWEVNVEGTRHVLAAAVAQQAKKVIFISSSSVYGIPAAGPITEATSFAPFEAYGRSKVAAEEICQSYKDRLDVSIIRPRTIIGPGRMGILSLIFDWVSRHRPLVILGQGKNRYQLVSARDLAEAVYRISTADVRGEDFNVGTTRFGALREDLTAFLQGVNSRSRLYSFPAGIARLILPILSALRLIPFVTYQYTMADRDVYFSTEKMQRLLDWVPTKSNAEMLVEACGWYKSHPQAAGNSIHSKGLRRGILRLLG